MDISENAFLPSGKYRFKTSLVHINMITMLMFQKILLLNAKKFKNELDYDIFIIEYITTTEMWN